jgi:glutamate/aspartate transport system permease protein
MPRPFLALAYQFQWSVLWTNPYLGWLVWGVLTTLALTVVAWILATTLGAFFGAARTAPSRLLRGAGAVYVEFFRNVPLLVWMFFWYFGVPPLLPHGMQDWLFNHGAEFWAGMFALGVYHGARFSEVIRSGIQAIPRTQMEASVAIGLTTLQAYRMVVIPIALRLIVPPLTNETLNLLKNSSVALTISVAELTFQTRQVETYTAKAIEALTAGTVIYLLLCVSIAAIMGRVERRFAIPGLIVRTG